MDGLLWSGLKHWKNYNIANSVQILYKSTHDFGNLALGLKAQGLSEDTNPKIEMWKLIHHKYLLTYAMCVSGVIGDSPMHHSKSSLVYLLLNTY